MRHVGTLALLALLCACNRSDNNSFKSVAVLEVPMRTAADHNDLISIMLRMAAANGTHVDDVSQKWMAFERSLPADGQHLDTRASIYVGVWRGSKDEDLEVDISDMMHAGRAWVSFLNGGPADLSANKRDQVLAEIKRHWPDARSVPVLPSGGEPLPEDLRLTPQGYKIVASSAARYGIPATSPVLVRD